MFNSLRALCINYQKTEHTNDNNLKEFQSRLTTLDDYITNAVDLVLCLVQDKVKELYDRMIDQAIKEEMNVAREYVLKKGSSTLLLIGANHQRHRAMKNEMQKNMAMSTNNHLKSVVDTMNILNTFPKARNGRVG